MLVKKIEYVDFKGVQRTEEFRFHLTEAEVLKWLRGTPGDYTLDAVLAQFSKKENGEKIIESIENLILTSYGELSLDGRRFVKSEEMSEEFKQTEAYSKLFMELALDAKKTSDFVNGIIPKDMADKARKLMDEHPGLADGTTTIEELKDIQ